MSLEGGGADRGTVAAAAAVPAIRVARLGRAVDFRVPGADDAVLVGLSRATYNRGDPAASEFPPMATLPLTDREQSPREKAELRIHTETRSPHLVRPENQPMAWHGRRALLAKGWRSCRDRPVKRPQESCGRSVLESCFCQCLGRRTQPTGHRRQLPANL